jgi:catechol 2,3-dioxygenase-like lactoylglutathione lyase family enzyme
MLLRHLALAVQDEQRSREFYERWFGFGDRPPRRYSDGVLMLYGPGDVALALGPAPGPPELPPFFHFGFTLDDPARVRELRAALEREGVAIVEAWEEDDYVSVKCRDPDGYVVEASWEPA